MAARRKLWRAAQPFIDPDSLVFLDETGVNTKMTGSVRNFVCGRADEHYAAMALMNRSAKTTANWALAMDHSRGGVFHSFSDRFKIR